MAAHRSLDPSITAAQLPPGICAFGIMTKAPEAGKVKTRLTPAEAADIFRAMIAARDDLGRGELDGQ